MDKKSVWKPNSTEITNHKAYIDYNSLCQVESAEWQIQKVSCTVSMAKSYYMSGGNFRGAKISCALIHEKSLSQKYELTKSS